MSYIPNIPKHKIGDFCPACKSNDKKSMKQIGTLKKRRGKFGEFLGCSTYPKCKYIQNIKVEHPQRQLPG